MTEQYNDQTNSDFSIKVKPGHMLALSIIALALAACRAMTGPPTSEIEHTQAAPTEVAPTPTQEKQTPTKLTVPPDTVRALAILAVQFNFDLTQEESGWDLTAQRVSDDDVETVRVLEVVADQTTGEPKIRIEVGDGSVREYPPTSIESVPTFAIGVEKVLTVQGENGEVELFFYPDTGEWVKPIEIQTNPEDPNTYPEIELEDVWSGRLLWSVALNAEAFPEGTLTPTGFIYERARNYEASAAILVPWIEGSSDLYSDHGYDETVNKDNDYRRLVSFTRSSFDSQYYGPVEVIIATQQINAPGGKTLFVNYLFGPEWPVTESERLPNGHVVNLVDSVFLAKDPENLTEANRYRIEPVVSAGGGFRSYSRSIDPETGIEVYTVGIEFYEGFGPQADQNQILPPEIAEMVKEFRRTDGDFIWAEIDDLASLGTSFVVAGIRNMRDNFLQSSDQNN